MTTTIRVPAELELLHERLSGLGRLITARRWERAAIVYAFTEVGERGAGRWRKPDPPKMHIREFAAQGFSGLTTNKAVSRYRDAWVSAISNGWASPVAPGQEVTLPDEEFPPWPYGPDYDGDSTVTYTEGDDTVADMRDYRPYTQRSVTERVLSHLEEAAKALGQLADLTTHDIDDETRTALVEQLSALQHQTSEVLRALRGTGLTTV